MYESLKSLIKAIIPKKTLFKFEPLLRLVLYQFYKGDNFKCNICGKNLRKFIRLKDGEKLCPNCGSISRSRRLWEILNSGFVNENIKILDFSPSRHLYRILKIITGIEYVSSDLSGNFISDFQFDITDIASENDVYNLIICYHILEHIENDYQAINELFRVLKPGGTCIVQTPFKDGDIYENASIKSEAERFKHFGQKDHVRIYSVNGLKERLIKCGFHVDIKNFNEVIDNKFGFKTNEMVLVCTK
jgi:SAM-dependent methyltransferase